MKNSKLKYLLDVLIIAALIFSIIIAFKKDKPADVEKDTSVESFFDLKIYPVAHLETAEMRRVAIDFLSR